MPYFMDRHELKGATPADVAAAHLADLGVQERHGVDYITYWFDYERQSGFCLARGPSRDAVEAVHRESHGLTALEVIEADEATVARFMGAVPTHAPGEAYEDSAFRAILFTDMVGSTDLTQRLGDARAMAVLRRHDQIVREQLAARAGSEVKHTGDGIMASFRSVVGAIQCAIAVQQSCTATDDAPLSVRIGIAAGEPVAESGDLFGSVVQLAARLTARAAPGGILVSAAVRDLAQGKGFRFAGDRRVRLKGFAEPVRLDEVIWQDPV